MHSLPCALGRFAMPAGVFPLPVGISRLRLSAIPIPIAILYSHDPYPLLWRLVAFLLQFISNIIRWPGKQPFQPASGDTGKKYP